VKLENALAALGVDPAGRHCLDVGASTGGFTDCLLQRGAAHVVCVDVAYGELDWRLRTDERVTVLERVNARALTPEQLPYAPDLVVADVSFISLTKVLPAVLACCAGRFDVLAMVKPQFEVGRERVGKGGVVREAADRRAALVAVASAAGNEGAAVLGFASSGLPGPKGNRETFVWLAEAGRAGAVGDLEAAAAAVDG
jgi:23S rRNA (cytidine1920-2'-O)/16S rRNA (cytidine1409-2'-O)-methyltransferase